MDRNLLRQNIKKSALHSFSLSGGPGGQNVNKVNTKVIIHLTLEDLTCLSAKEREVLKIKLKPRLNSSGQLVQKASKTRSQLKNRQEALTNLEELIVKALENPKKRRSTKPSRASIRRRLDTKKHRKQIKQIRRRVDPE